MFFFSGKWSSSDDKKKAAMLLSDQHKFSNYFAPDRPTTKSINKLTAKMKQHFSPENVEIAEVASFY